MKKAFFIILVLFSMAGCSWFQTEPDKSAEELAQEGKEYFASERYKKAIDSYKRLKDWYPFSKYATEAELKIADAHFEIEEYTDAILAYEEFENLHPTNENTPYVIYQIGYCYFVQVDTIDRDQSTAQKALETFDRLMKSYPRDPYSIRAQEHRKVCLKNLTGNEIYVGLFYYNEKRYQAAMHRFKSVITDYPDVGLHQTALRYMTLCEEAIRKQGLSKKKTDTEPRQKPTEG
ncbi:MAG: outer membrane protein assembly factor BamD [Thermodesulfobacteriota bacterium]